jgi:cobalt/nickel transport system permease protein
LAIFFLGERFHRGSGLLYDTDARVKLVLAIAFAFVVTTIPVAHWGAFIAFGGFVAMVIAFSRLPLRLVFSRSALALPFIAVAIPLLFTREGTDLFDLPIVGWSASKEGAEAVASIMLRSWFAVLVATVLTGVTEPLHLLRAIERLRVPRVLASALMFMYRYLFVIGEEGRRLMTARDSRSARPAGASSVGGSVAWRGRVLGNMIGSLFLRCYERSERVYLAMRARGYDGRIRFAKDQTMTARDWSVLCAASFTLAGLVAYAQV